MLLKEHKFLKHNCYLFPLSWIPSNVCKCWMVFIKHSLIRVPLLRSLWLTCLPLAPRRGGVRPPQGEWQLAEVPTESQGTKLRRVWQAGQRYRWNLRILWASPMQHPASPSYTSQHPGLYCIELETQSFLPNSGQISPSSSPSFHLSHFLDFMPIYLSAAFQDFFFSPLVEKRIDFASQQANHQKKKKPLS